MRVSTMTADLAQDVSRFASKLTGKMCSAHSSGIVGDVPIALWEILNLKYSGQGVFLDHKPAKCESEDIAHIESNGEDIVVHITRNDGKPKKLYFHKRSGNWYFKEKADGYTAKRVVEIRNMEELTEYAHNADYIKVPSSLPWFRNMDRNSMSSCRNTF